MKKRLAVLVLAFAMVLTMSASVFAAGQNNSTTNPSYAADEAKLVKYAQIPEGVDLTKTAMADKQFTFTFEAQDPTGASTTANYAVPKSDFEAKNFSVTTDKLSVDTAWSSAGVAETQNKVWEKSITDIFANFEFPRAGEYTFKVKETAGAAGDKWVYASDEYILRLIVKNDPTQADPDNKTISDVTVQDKDGAKVDPSDDNPADNTDPTDPDAEPTPADSLGGFTFTNNYKPTVDKHDEPTNPNPDEDPTTPSDPTDIDKTNPNTGEDGAFELDKFVLGEFGDRTADWTFNITVTLPKNYKDFTLPTGWTDGTAKEETLKHGETFTFAELPVGTKIEVKEAGPVTGYTQLLTTSKTTDVEAGLNDDPATTGGTVLVTENGGYAICRNSFDDESITPTGIIINNLPYILLIGLALGGIVLFSRKRRYE